MARSLFRPLLLAILAATDCVHGVRLAEGDALEAGSTTGTGALQAGDHVLDRFELLSRVATGAWPRDITGFQDASFLGRGAFGETWLAFDKKRGQKVAVKFFYRAGYKGAVTLLNMRMATPEEQSQLRKDSLMECETPAKIIAARAFPEGQARFAKCFENAVNDPKYAHLVLEVAGTENLEDYVARQGKLKEAVVKRIAKMMLEGLAQMENSFVHRDIKPANIMVYEDAEDDNVYLRYIDLGLVVKDGIAADVAGTPMFLPPEMWPLVPTKPPRMTYHFDIYSAGETVYQLICGKTFHEIVFDKVASDNMREIDTALKTMSPLHLCEPSPELGPLLQLVVGKMMPATPSNRASATVLLQDSIFAGLSTTKQAPLLRPSLPRDVQVTPSVEPVFMKPAEAAKKAEEPSFLDSCHDDKSFWFENAVSCCLREQYDARRSQVCERPCGPNIAYKNGECADQCQQKMGDSNMFNKELHCCVATVFPKKCKYREPLAAGEGWRWMN